MSISTPPSLVRALHPDTQSRLYDFYDRLRATDPLFWDHRINGWIATGHDIVSAGANDPRLSSVRYPNLDAVPEVLRPFAEVMSRQMIYSDAPSHPRMRSLLSKAFTPRAVEFLRDRITDRVERLFDSADAADGRIDLIADIGYPLPVGVICDILEVPHGDRPQLKRWAAAIATAQGNARIGNNDAVVAVENLDAMIDYLRTMISTQQEASRSLIATALQAEPDGSRLTEEELLANIVLILTAGHETTTNLIGNGVLALTQHPDQWHRLVDDPGLIPSAVEEILRFDSPLQILTRRAREDMELGGRTVKGGDLVLLIIGAANRDGTAFPSPHQFDVGRDGPRHVGFGHGRHFCLGTALARLEGEIVLRSLVARYSSVRLVDQELKWNRNLALRGLTRLAVELVPRTVD